MYMYLIKHRALRKPAPHELDPRTAAQALAASVKGFATAVKSPYVIDKFVKWVCLQKLLMARHLICTLWDHIPSASASPTALPHLESACGVRGPQERHPNLGDAPGGVPAGPAAAGAHPGRRPSGQFQKLSDLLHCTLAAR